jgi:large subunit ribosomal protein L30
MSKGILVVRLRSNVHVRHDVDRTLKSLNLTRINHAVIVPDTPVFRGMLQHAKDYITFGPIDAESALEILSKRGRLEGGKPLTDAHLAENSPYKTLKDFAAALAEGRARLGNVPGVKPILRLAPPRKGHEGIKHSFRAGGALGDRGDNIRDLALRMV